MSNYHLSEGDTPDCHVTQQGERCCACFTHPCEMTVFVSQEAFKTLAEKDLYELCLTRLTQTLALAKLELAEYGESGAFCVRWKNSMNLKKEGGD